MNTVQALIDEQAAARAEQTFLIIPESGITLSYGGLQAAVGEIGARLSYLGIPKGGQEVVACVALKPGAACSEDDLLNHCHDGLGRYQSPKRIRFLDELPKGPSGKIQRLALADLSFDV